MPRLVLINPVSDPKRGIQSRKITRFPPLGLASIAAMTPSAWDIRLLDENVRISPFPEADLVGITSFTSTINRAYEIASSYRQRNIPVVMGGIHPTMMPEEALCHADCVVVGEGEWVWPKVLKDLESGSLRKIYKADPEELISLPFPRRDLFDSGYSWGTIQTSRGCPMDCHFCSVTAFNGRRFRQRPLEHVWDELKTIPQRNIFFVDDNILGYGKDAEDRAIRFFRGMVERGMRKRFVCQTSLNFAQNTEVLKWAEKAGCKMIFVGLESISEHSLKHFGKAYNLKRGTGSYAESIRRCHDFGIGVIGALMFGSDGEDPGIFQKTLNFIQESGLDVIQITFATPLPGTRFFEKLLHEARLTHTDFPMDWRAYSFSKILFRTKGMSAEDLYRGMASVKDGLYSFAVFTRRVFRTLKETRNFTTAFLSYKLNKGYRKGYMETSYFKPYSSLHRNISKRCLSRDSRPGLPSA
ncbi:MAG: radical SAM protein [bacterium]